ncbi:hypothetical protein V6N13_129796 [Hibiscus sabdariffa]
MSTVQSPAPIVNKTAGIGSELVLHQLPSRDYRSMKLKLAEVRAHRCSRVEVVVMEFQHQCHKGFQIPMIKKSLFWELGWFLEAEE